MTPVAVVTIDPQAWAAGYAAGAARSRAPCPYSGVLALAWCSGRIEGLAQPVGTPAPSWEPRR